MGSLDRGGYCAGISDVGCQHGHGHPGGCPNLRCRFFQRACRSREQSEPDAFLGEAKRDGFTDPLAGARDERRAISQSQVHSQPLPQPIGIYWAHHVAGNAFETVMITVTARSPPSNCRVMGTLIPECKGALKPSSARCLPFSGPKRTV